MKIIIKSVSILMVILIFLSTNVIAVSQSDLNDVNKNIDKIKGDIKNVEEEKSSTMQEISKLNVRIYNLESQISEMQAEIDELEASIAGKEEEIKEKQEQFEENFEKYKVRLVASYEAGQTTYLDVLLSSKKVTDILSNWYYLTELAKADKAFQETLIEQQQEIENSKVLLEKSKAKIEANKENIEKDSTALKEAQQLKKNEVVKLSDQEKTLQEELDKFEQDKKEIERKLAELARQEAVVITGAPSSHGYIFPVAGLSKGNIANKSYPSYPGHTGSDININVVGKNVVAVKAGTVVTSTASYGSIANYDSNGNYIASYRSYGEYIIINHHDGTMTLYGHLKPGSRKVSEGQTVQQGQIIGTVGNTGNCQPRPTPSNPLNGTHLHFEVRINGKCVNPIPYLP